MLREPKLWFRLIRKAVRWRCEAGTCTATMSDPNVAAAPTAAAAAVAATIPNTQQIQGAAGRPKMPTIEKARMKQMLDDPEVQQELSKLVPGNAPAAQTILGILRAMATSTDINSDPKILEQLKAQQVGQVGHTFRAPTFLPHQFKGNLLIFTAEFMDEDR